jgi:acetylornithine/N-succinyldiaminopimelate aminotransferase
VLDIMEKDGVIENVAKMGDYLKEKLGALKEKHPQLIKEVRGQGLLIGVELYEPGQAVALSCLAKKFILNCTAGNVLRFIPPLTVKKREIDFALAVLDEALSAQS